MSLVAIIQARMGSTRLPGKVMRQAAGKLLLAHVIERVQACAPIADLVVATTDLPEDRIIVDWCLARLIKVVSWNRVLPDGSNDVLRRFCMAAKAVYADAYVRVTADCPLWCPELGAEVIASYLKGYVHYCANIHPQLDGFDTEVFSRAALFGADRQADAPYDRQHVTPYMRRHTTQRYVDQTKQVGGIKLSVDTPEDFARVRAILERVQGLTWKDTFAAVQGERKAG
jgi:spore coat polysaccharide biosynthesis protein SpsF (cytidylyltransferase family)